VAAQVRFEVRLAEDRPVPGLIVAEAGHSGRVVYLHTEAVVGNDDIAQTWVIDDGTDRFGVGVQFLSGGAERMRRFSAGHIGRPVAILIDGTVVMAPVVRSVMGDSAIINGAFTREEAARIAEGIERR
jgi:preprotein translocase subunit SecD